MDYIFGTKGNQETLTTKNSSNKVLTGHRKVIRNFEDIQLVTDEFDIVEQLESTYSVKRYIIENHERIIDTYPFDFDALPKPIPDYKFSSWISSTSSASDLEIPIKDNTWLDNQGTVNLIKRISGNYYYVDRYQESDRLCLFKADTSMLENDFLNCFTYSDGTHPTLEPSEYTFSDGKKVKDNLVQVNGSFLTNYGSNGSNLSLVAPGMLTVRVYLKRGCTSLSMSFTKSKYIFNYKNAKNIGLHIPVPGYTSYADVSVDIGKHVLQKDAPAAYTVSKVGTKSMTWLNNVGKAYFNETFTESITNSYSTTTYPSTQSNLYLPYFVFDFHLSPYKGV